MTRFIRIASAAMIVTLAVQLTAESRKVLKVAITASGEITADGRPTSLEGLIPILRELAKNKGEVCTTLFPEPSEFVQRFGLGRHHERFCGGQCQEQLRRLHRRQLYVMFFFDDKVTDATDAFGGGLVKSLL
jgi:hypothetical protein